jgi:hypothetical protein
MKFYLTTLCSLGMILLCDAAQAGMATTEQTFLPNIHLVRGGGGHAGRRAFENRDNGAGMERASEGEAAAHSTTDTSSAAADRTHSLDNTPLNNWRNDEGYWGAEGWGGAAGCAETDANGNCISYQTN